MRSATIFNFLIEANIMASIAILLMIPLRKLLRKQMGNTAICFGWLLIALRLLIPLTLPNPLIHEIRPAYLDDTAIRPIAGQIKVRLVDAIGDLGRVFWQAGNRQAYSDMQKVAVGVDYNGYPAVLAWIWLGGCVLILLWFIYKNVKFRKTLRNNRIEEISGELKDLYLQLCKERKVKPVSVYFTDPVPGACLVGVFKPYIVLPLITAPQDVKNVLTHEVCHLKNKDHLWGVLRLFCCAIHWFNPLVWIAASMSRTDSELRCDDRVTGPMNESERKEYANVLVLAAARKSMPGLGVMATGMTMTGRSLKERVDSILRSGRVKRGLALAFAVLASMCLIGAFATSEVARVWNIPLEEMDADLRRDYTVDTELLRAFVKGVKALMQEDAVIRVGCFDTRFYGFREIHSEADIDALELRGAGGTNFTVAVNAFTGDAENQIIFTDGYAEMPEQRCDALWVVYGTTPIHPKGGRVIYAKPPAEKEKHEIDFLIT